MTCRLNFNLSERLSCRYRGESHTEFVVLRVQTTYCSVVVLHRFINCTYLELCVFHCNRHCSTQTTCIDCRPYPKILSHSEWNVECDPGRSHQGLLVLDIVPYLQYRAVCTNRQITSIDVSFKEILLRDKRCRCDLRLGM